MRFRVLVRSGSSPGSLVWSGSGVHFGLAWALVCACSMRSIMVGMGLVFLHDVLPSPNYIISLRGRLRGWGLYLVPAVIVVAVVPRCLVWLSNAAYTQFLGVVLGLPA